MLLLFIAPTLATLIALLVTLACLPRVWASLEAPVQTFQDAQEWADALAMEISVDEEWEALCEAAEVDAEWIRMADEGATEAVEDEPVAESVRIVSIRDIRSIAPLPAWKVPSVAEDAEALSSRLEWHDSFPRESVRFAAQSGKVLL